MFKKYFEGKKAILFDLDGTLVDTEEFSKNAIQEVIQSEKIPFIDVDDVHQEGASTKERWQATLRAYELDDQYNYEELDEKTHKLTMQALQNVEELDTREGFWSLAHELKIDKNLAIGLVTNTDRQMAEITTKKADLNEIFDLYLYGDNVKNPKPNAEIYRKALKMLKMKPKEVLVFEDSIPGTQAAVKAGLDTIVIWNGETDTYKYPREVEDFMPSFLGLAGNLDMTYAEGLEKALKNMKNAQSEEEA
jgi:HAD superfamily hydrolase (TIGR01509 family)